MRMFYCYPFGRSDANSVHIYGKDFPEDLIETFKETKELLASTLDSNYTLFFDQEPIDLARHRETFDQIQKKTHDINIPWRIKNRENYAHLSNDEWFRFNPPTDTGIIVTSEKNSSTVEEICSEYNWRQAYYFFHGWAALDWYRGYNRSFLIAEPKDRVITKTFIAPNRIIAGERKHRLIMLYYIFKYGMTDNHISCPKICPAENMHIMEAVKSLTHSHPDIEKVFAPYSFPIEFAGESDSPMHSYQLSLFTESAESLLYLVTETVATGRRLHLTEKTFKPICLRMPFMIVGTQGSLAYLRSYGFKTFGDLWDESYDDEINDDQRIEKIAFTLKAMDILSPAEKQRLFDMAQEICEHNYNHFYNGGFESILWNELNGMLNEIKQI